jgi:hypothetical protein
MNIEVNGERAAIKKKPYLNSQTEHMLMVAFLLAVASAPACFAWRLRERVKIITRCSTTWIRVLLKNLIVPELVKKYPSDFATG